MSIPRPILRENLLDYFLEAAKPREQWLVGMEIEQMPRAGSSVRRGRKVKLVVSLGGEVLAVPDLIGQASRAVEIDGVERLPATRHPELPVEQRIHTFDEVDLVVTEELMQAEANRCMRCGTLCFFKDVERNRHRDGKGLRARLDEFARVSPDP